MNEHPGKIRNQKKKKTKKQKKNKKAFSWETNLWVMLGDFKIKIAELGRNMYLTENRLSWNKMCCASDNHNS